MPESKRKTIINAGDYFVCMKSLMQYVYAVCMLIKWGRERWNTVIVSFFTIIEYATFNCVDFKSEIYNIQKK